MPPVPWQLLLPYYGPEDDDRPSEKVIPPIAEVDNSAIMGIRDPIERANQIARALAAGTPRSHVQALAGHVLDGLLGRDH